MSSRSRGVWPNLRCKKRAGAQKNGEGNRYKSMEKRRNGDACKSARRGNRGRETRPKSPAKQALFASAKNRQRNRCGRRAESGKVCFQRDLLEKRGRKGRLFSANADKGDKKGEKRAKSCGKDDARKRRDGAKEQKLQKAQNRRGEFICRGRNPLGAEKQRKDDFIEKTFVWKAGVIFSKKVWTDRERDFFVREEKSGGAEKKRNLYLFPEEGGRSVQRGKAPGSLLLPQKDAFKRRTRRRVF